MKWIRKPRKTSFRISTSDISFMIFLCEKNRYIFLVIFHSIILDRFMIEGMQVNITIINTSIWIVLEISEIMLTRIRSIYSISYKMSNKLSHWTLFESFCSDLIIKKVIVMTQINKLILRNYASFEQIYWLIVKHKIRKFKIWKSLKNVL